MSTLDVIKSYYSSQSNKDDQWKELWSDDAVFSDASQTLLANGKEAVIQSFTPFLKGVAALKISQMIVEGEKACFIISYTYVNQKKEYDEPGCSRSLGSQGRKTGESDNLL